MPTRSASASAALSAASALRSLSKDEINDLPLLAYEGEIVLVDSGAGLDLALDRLEHETLLGFDTETRPSFKRGKSYPTTLVQLAGADVVVLVHLVQAPFSQRLAALLANPGVIKAGVAIHEDIRCLRKVQDFEPAALVDLADLAGHLGLRARGLRTLAADIMGARISKAAQCSNWAKKELTAQQIKYAATDAWIGRELYLRLKALAALHAPQVLHLARCHPPDAPPGRENQPSSGLLPASDAQPVLESQPRSGTRSAPELRRSADTVRPPRPSVRRQVRRVP